MVRVGGMGYTLNVDAGMGRRISGMFVLGTDAPMEANKEYRVAGWGSVREGAEGPPIWHVVAAHLKNRLVLSPTPRKSVNIVRAG
jgi:sulfur-oxidizing protein SoxB